MSAGVRVLPINPKLERLIVDAIDAAIFELHTGLPARVVRFDLEKQCADVQPLLLRFYRTLDDEIRQLELAQVQNAPVVFPAFGPWSITAALRPGEIVYLTFAERSLDKWLEAPAGTLVDPVDARKHSISDAIVVPGLRPRTQALTVHPENLRIAHESGAVVIELEPARARVKAPEIVLDAGGDADQSIPRGEDLVQALQLLTVPTAFGPSGTPINAAAFPSTLSAKAKVK